MGLAARMTMTARLQIAAPPTPCISLLTCKTCWLLLLLLRADFYTELRHEYTLQLWALNEARAGSVKDVFRPWDDRLNFDAPTLDSNEDDPELLIHVPFNGAVKLMAICLIGGTDGTAPSELKAYVNRFRKPFACSRKHIAITQPYSHHFGAREDLDFGTVAELAPVQKWDLQENLRGEIEWPTQ